MKRLLISFVLLAAIPIATIPTDSRAQEFEEELNDIAAQLREAESEKRSLQLRLQLAGQRITLLTEVRRLMQLLPGLTKQIEAVEAKGDEPKLQRIEEQVEATELGIELAHAKLELLEKRGSLLNILGELSEPDFEPLRREAQSLLKMTNAASALIERLFKLYRNGPEPDVEEIEQEVEAFEETFERRREILQLKLELHWAREEGAEEEIRELEVKLKDLLVLMECLPRMQPYQLKLMEQFLLKLEPNLL